MTRIQKIKKFVNAHKVEILCYSALAALTGVTFYVAHKMNVELNEWIQQETAAGNVVHQLIDGSYISVKYTTNN